MEDTLKNKVSGVKLDFDENDKPFHRLSLYLQEPYTKDEIYMEWPKTESKEVLIEKESKRDSKGLIYPYGGKLKDLTIRNLRQSVLNFKKPSSFFGKSDDELNLINLKEPFEYLLIADFKFLIPQSSL